MKLSVIVISYNEEKYLSQAIDSCLEQDFQDFEIIIGDDGSSDGSIDLIKKYAEEYPDKISYFIMERNQDAFIFSSDRVSAIIKRAATEAKGKYITILSGDDFFCSNHKFSKQIDCLEGEETHKYYACGSGYKQFWSDGRELCFLNHEGNMPNNCIFWAYSYLHISCFVFRKEVFTSKYMLKLFCDDVGLVYSLVCMGEWCHIEDITLAYRQRDTSIMHEADSLELSLVDILMLQDCLDIGVYNKFTYARFGPYLNYCIRKHKFFRDEKYAKYRHIASPDKYKLVYDVMNYDKLSLGSKIKLRWLAIKSLGYHYYYRKLNCYYRSKKNN